MRLPHNPIYTIVPCLGIVAMIATGNARATCFPVFFGSMEDHHVLTPGVCDSGPPCSETSVTENFTGSFWALGFGDPQTGLGVDNGTWPAREGLIPDESGWIISPPGEQAILAGYWGADPRTDGCIYSNCMAVMLSDQFGDYDGTGYFAVASSHASPGGDFMFESDIVLTLIPRPQILATHFVYGGGLELTIVVNAPTGGAYLDAACSQDVVRGYKLYWQSPGTGSLNRSDWNLATGGAGPNGAPIPFGTATTIVMQPWCSGRSYYFAASVGFEGGFETAHVSRIIHGPITIPEFIDNDCDNVSSFDMGGGMPIDCDDSDPAVYPGAPQICDHRNNDCNAPNWPSLVGTNEDGADLDNDSWGGACDNCADVANASQSDVNADGNGDACDLDDGLILLGFEDDIRLAWQEELGFDGWNVYRSSLATLRATGAYTQVPGSNAIAGRECGLALPSSDDAFVPATGDVALYLVTGNVGGSEGSLGSNSGGQSRINTHPCP